MFQFDFGGTTRSTGAVLESAIDFGGVDRVAVTYWEEHCLECAQPQCYRSCPLYIRRPDTNCARFAGGIRRHLGFRGLLPHAAEIRFRTWGKLQTTIGGGSLRDVRIAKPQTWYNKMRTSLFERTVRAGAAFRPDELVIEAWSLGPEPFRLCVELETDEAVLHRESFSFVPGHNLHRSRSIIDRLPPPGRTARLLVHPENDHEAHLAFTWLDLVAWRARPAQAAAAPAVKCVVWDLDDTLWRGIVGDDGPDGVRIREECVALLRGLDARGIVQSIASKNDHGPAWALLERLGVAEYFLHPQIGWDAKSVAVRRIADLLGIGIDAVAVIDDSAFERAEIAAALPGVRTYDPAAVEGLLARPEFTVPITAEARNRRALYVAEDRRRAALAEADIGVVDFLRGCGMVLTVSNSFADADLDRSAELLQRTNQLNLSGRRLTRAEVERMVRDPAGRCLHLRCADRFGDYGLIGFVALQPEGDALVITDLVLSCRVATKKVENALASHLQACAVAMGARRIMAKYVPTPRNGVLLAALRAAGFAESAHGADLVLDVDTVVPDSDVVRVEATG